MLQGTQLYNKHFLTQIGSIMFPISVLSEQKQIVETLDKALKKLIKL